MILTHTIKYKAVKTTAGSIFNLRKYENYFYDPADESISSISDSFCSSVDWICSQRKNKVLYLLEEIDESIKLNE